AGDGEQPLAGREHRAERGVLRDDRPPGGEERRAAIAEPARAEPDVLVLGDRELRPRAADEVAVAVEVAVERPRLAHGEAEPLELLLVARLVPAEREIERLSRASGQRQELAPLGVLAPAVRLPAVADAAPAL